MSDPTIEERIAASEIRAYRVAFPSLANHYDTLFSARAIEFMDEAAFIAATRLARKRLITVSSRNIDFLCPVPTGSIVELVARVTEVGRTSLKAHAELFIDLLDGDREKAAEGTFSFVAIDERDRPVAVLDV